MKKIIECRLIGNLMHSVHIAASLSLSLSLSPYQSQTSYSVRNVHGDGTLHGYMLGTAIM